MSPLTSKSTRGVRDLDIFPKKGEAEQERLALEIDEFERGYPRLSLSIIMDVVGACHGTVSSSVSDARAIADYVLRLKGGGR